MTPPKCGMTSVVRTLPCAHNAFNAPTSSSHISLGDAASSPRALALLRARASSCHDLSPAPVSGGPSSVNLRSAVSAAAGSESAHAKNVATAPARTSPCPPHRRGIPGASHVRVRTGHRSTTSSKWSSSRPSPPMA
eukprot:30971-Pelagococcus_subviridis.AAC.10